MAARKDSATSARRSELNAAAGSERAAFFAWNGGLMWTAQNGRAKASRDACRGPVTRRGSDDR